MSKKKILIAAGGSGGHLFPAQQLAEQLQQEDVMIAGHNISKSPFFHKKVPCKDIDASSPKNLFRFVFATIVGFCKSCVLIYRFSPDVVVGFGSYHTFPILLAATLLRKKMVLFEANCVLGKVNRLFASVSTVATQFPQKSSTLVPLLPWTEQKKTPASKQEAFSYFGLDSQKRTILVFGGSQGAGFLNDTMPKVKLPTDIQLIHCTGRGSVQYPNNVACVKEFEKRMDLAYLIADIAVCRSGAGTIAELLRSCTPSLLIPFPFASENHQLENARFLAHTVKGAKILEQAQASPEKIGEEIETLFAQASRLQETLNGWKMGTPTEFVCLII